MILLTKLAASPLDQNIQLPRASRTAMHYEVEPGCFIHIDLGPGGLSIRHGENGVLIPIPDLVALAQKHEPCLIPKQLRYDKPVEP